MTVGVEEFVKDGAKRKVFAYEKQTPLGILGESNGIRGVRNHLAHLLHRNQLVPPALSIDGDAVDPGLHRFFLKLPAWLGVLLAPLSPLML